MNDYYIKIYVPNETDSIDSIESVDSIESFRSMCNFLSSVSLQQRFEMVVKCYS